MKPANWLRCAVCVAACGIPAFAGSLTEGLIAHYPMKELKGQTIKDMSGNKRDAAGNDITVVDGRGGKVFSFDGKKSEVFLPDLPVFEITGDYSVSFWMRIPVNSEAGGPIYAQPGFTIADFRGGIRVTFRNPEYPKTGYADLMGPKVNDGEWHHVVLSYRAESGETVLYLDALEAGKGVFIHKPAVSTPTTVGFIERGHFAGELSDLRVYSRALDVIDAADLHNAAAVP